MKKAFFAIALACMVAMCPSCEKSGTEIESDDNLLAGYWTWGDEADLDEYFEYTNTGLVKVYITDNNPGYASYKDGVLSYPGEWEFEYAYQYWIKDGLYWDEEEGICEFEMIGKDKFSLSGTTTKGERWTCYFVRIKKFSK